MDMRKLVGRNLARLRREKRFTQERFAEVSGYTQQYVSDVERGLRNPTIVTIYNIATALGVSHVDLVTPDDIARREEAKLQKRKIRKEVKKQAGSPRSGQDS
jgi:transcriptional regulator with XRE-family HTH domain